MHAVIKSADGCLLQCVVGGCTATFASQGGLARHVPTHFSYESSTKVSSQSKMKEESPSKAGLNKRRKLRNKLKRSLRKYNCHMSPNQAFIICFFNLLKAKVIQAFLD